METGLYFSVLQLLLLLVVVLQWPELFLQSYNLKIFISASAIVFWLINLHMHCSQPQNPCEALILLAASRICLIHSFASFFFPAFYVYRTQNSAGYSLSHNRSGQGGAVSLYSPAADMITAWSVCVFECKNCLKLSAQTTASSRVSLHYQPHEEVSRSCQFPPCHWDPVTAWANPNLHSVCHFHATYETQFAVKMLHLKHLFPTEKRYWGNSSSCATLPLTFPHSVLFNEATQTEKEWTIY